MNIKKRLKNLKYRIIYNITISKNEHLALIEELKEYINKLETDLENLLEEHKSEE